MTREEAPLDYDQLVNDYHHDLFHTLRGHRSLEYLETWVPDYDHVKSIVNMVEAAELSGRSDIYIRLSPGTAAGLCLDALVRELAPFGKLSTTDDAGGLVLLVERLGESR